MTVDPLVSALDNPLRLKLLDQLKLGDMRVQELCDASGAPMNLVSYHLRILREAGLVRERRSIADGRDQYYSLRLRTLQDQYLELGSQLHPSLTIHRSCLPAVEFPGGIDLKVLFLCTHNSARSQMAEAILKANSNDVIEVYSAGTHPERVHPLAVEVLKERGYQVSALHSKSLMEFVDQTYDYVITVCDRAREECPVFSGAARGVHWSIPDPIEVDGPLATRRRAFEDVADELEAHIEALLISIQQEEKRPS